MSRAVPYIGVNWCTIYQFHPATVIQNSSVSGSQESDDSDKFSQVCLYSNLNRRGSS